MNVIIITAVIRAFGCCFHTRVSVAGRVHDITEKKNALLG